MTINFLINHTEPLVTERKAQAKNVNTESYNYNLIQNQPRYIGERWFSIVVDDDGYVLLTEWISHEEAERRFIEHSDTTIEL